MPLPPSAPPHRALPIAIVNVPGPERRFSRAGVRQRLSNRTPPRSLGNFVGNCGKRGSKQQNTAHGEHSSTKLHRASPAPRRAAERSPNYSSTCENTIENRYCPQPFANHLLSQAILSLLFFRSPRCKVCRKHLQALSSGRAQSFFHPILDRKSTRLNSSH